MITKHSSPVVVTTGRTMRDLHPGYRRSFWAEYSEVIMLAGGFLGVYLFVMYCLPTVGSHEYSRAMAELQYYWQNTLEMKQHQLRVEYYPYIKSLFAYVESFLSQLS